LNPAWLERHARRTSRARFVGQTVPAQAQAMFHCTDRASAEAILREGTLLGTGAPRAARFHETFTGACDRAARRGVLLGFVWRGPMVTGVAHDAGGLPDILYDVPVSDSDRRLLELRLYPGSGALELSYVELPGRAYALDAPRRLRVVDPCRAMRHDDLVRHESLAWAAHAQPPLFAREPREPLLEAGDAPPFALSVA